MKVWAVLFVSACMLVKAESGLAKDNSKCQDALALCKGVSCDNPGVANACPVTCGRCNPTDCGPGMYWNGTTCKPCLDGRWGRNCQKPCNKWCSGGTCHSVSGECENCTRDKYGKFCKETCDANCNNCTDTSSNCHRTTGACLCGCRPGLYGGTCEQRCPDNCRFRTCHSSGICVHGCKKGYFGPKCDENCGECVNQSCSRIGTCLKGCNSGWRGLKCNTNCSYNCEHSNCHQNGTCMACLGGFHGDQCNRNCSAGCATRECNRDGSCQCKKTNFGQQCLNTCSVTCLNTSCSQTSGECDYGCVSGWYGATCSDTCPDNCSAGTCNRDGGSCLSCRKGFRGTHCNMSCPPHCVECQQNASNCTSCEPGYFGNTCEKECDGCLDGRCKITDGLCTAGCKPSLYGPHCNHACSSNCRNRRCQVDNTNRTVLSCTVGCVDGMWGDDCASTCPGHCPRCSRTIGSCVKLSYVQSLRHRVRVLSTCIGVFLFGVGIVAAFIIIRKKCTGSLRGIYLSPVRTDNLDSDDISLQEFSENGESGQSHYETIPDDSPGGYEALTPSTSRSSGYTALPPSLDNVRVTGV